MKLTDYIVRELEALKVDTVFGYIGGNIADLIDSICTSGSIRFIENYHEQASSFSANAYAQVKQGVGVAIASSGPGACNLVNGIANAYFDSIPCIFLTGNVHSSLFKSTRSRQNGFQETDIVSIVSGITKFAVTVTNADDIRYYFEKARHLALEGRPGPVLLDIPYDIQRKDVDIDAVKGYEALEEKCFPAADAAAVAELINGAKRPLLLLGAGAGSAKSRELIGNLLSKAKIPVVASLLGLDVVPHDHACFVGFIGEYGNRYANLAIANCDLLLVVGSRLDERQIAGANSDFAKSAQIVHIDIDELELERSIPGFQKVHCSAELFLEKLCAEHIRSGDFPAWHAAIAAWKMRFPSEDSSTGAVNANNFIQKLSEAVPPDAIVTADVGQNQMVVAQSFRLSSRRRLLNSGGFGSMGYSLPAAIGAYYANRSAYIISVNGDGGFQMNMQELQTLVREKIPALVVILNNKSLGMVKRLQDRKFNGRTFGTVEGYVPPDFSRIAHAYGIAYLRISDVKEYGLIAGFVSAAGPAIIELDLTPEMKTHPEPGWGIGNQNPQLSPEEFEQIKNDVLING